MSGGPAATVAEAAIVARGAVEAIAKAAAEAALMASIASAAARKAAAARAASEVAASAIAVVANTAVRSIVRSATRDAVTKSAEAAGKAAARGADPASVQAVAESAAQCGVEAVLRHSVAIAQSKNLFALHERMTGITEEKMAKMTLDMDGLYTQVELDLDDSQISHIRHQIDRLKKHDIEFSQRALLISVLAIESIHSEPSRDWLENLNKEAGDTKELQSQFIDALGYHFFTQARSQRTPGTKTIEIFDAIRRMAEISWECRCIFRVPRQSPL